MNMKKMLHLIYILGYSCFFLGCSKSMPRGTSIESKMYKMKEPQFLYDLTYERDGDIIRKQHIWTKVFDIIDEADEFLIMDMFLYNDDYDRKYAYPKLAEDLTNKLIKKKNENPNIQIIMITDEVNVFYGAYKSEFLEKLDNVGIDVIVTDMEKLPDSNFIYSFFWKTTFRWFGTRGKGWLKNPFDPDGEKVTVRSYLKLMNFKANHRKVVISESGALITSSNPHDASAYHSNIAFYMDGKIVNSLINSELAVAEFSNEKFRNEKHKFQVKKNSIGTTKVKIITEGKIKANMIKVIDQLSSGDKLNIAVFYLSDRDVIESIIEASAKGVSVRVILDANKDAFGMKKNGVPNRPVAVELSNKSDGKIKIRWYNTHGEQFHTKIMHAKMSKESVIIGGSANFTRRNISDYNLETNVMIKTENDRKIVRELDNYFDMLWYNRDGVYTLALDVYYDASLLKKTLYRFQEWSGAATY